MKKKLPKAVLRTADDMNKETAETINLRQNPHPVDLKESSRNEETKNQNSKSNVIDIAPMGATAPARAASAENSQDRDREEKRRRLKAVAIVERHANYSAIGGVIPLPIVNMASVTVVIVRMIRSLSKLYGAPFEHTQTRAIVIGLIGGMMPTGLATVTASTLIYLVPGSNLLGLAASSVTASAYARSIGNLFIEHFENGSTLIDFPTAVLR